MSATTLNTTTFSACTRTGMRRARAGAAVAIVILIAMTSGCGEANASPADGHSAEDPSRVAQQALFARWLRLWNGDYTGTDEFIAADFRLHAALLDGSSDTAIRGVAGITQWVQQTRAALNVEFTVEVGPLVDGDYVVARWTAAGTYRGGFPGSTAPAGTALRFAGTDILRVESGKIVEYWINSDQLSLLTQIAAR